MPFDEFGGPQFGLQDVKIALWNGTDDYGTPVDVPSVQMMGTVLGVVSATLEGDDTTTATASRAIGGQVQLRFGSISLDALEVLLGQSSTSSMDSPNAVRHLRIDGGHRLPYFGIVGKTLAEEGGGDFWVFVPKVRITGDVNLAMLQYGQFAVPELTAQAVADGTWGIVNMVAHETEAAITIPPENITPIS